MISKMISFIKSFQTPDYVINKFETFDKSFLQEYIKGIEKQYFRFGIPGTPVATEVKDFISGIRNPEVRNYILRKLDYLLN